jgi:hypothetical protein
MVCARAAKRGLRADEAAASRRDDTEGKFLVDFDEKVFESRKAELKARLKSSALLPVHRPALADEYASASESSSSGSSDDERKPRRGDGVSRPAAQDIEITDVFGRQVWVPSG